MNALLRILADYAGAVAYLMPLGGFNVMLAQDWINGGGSGAADRRRLTAATMVLEYTAARPNLSPPLIEWVCEQLAKYPAPALEQTWLRASIALVEGRQAWTILTGETASHLAHARERFPNNAHFKLAEAVAAEATASDPSVRAPSGDRGMVIDLISGVGRVSTLAIGGPFLYWPGGHGSVVRDRLNGTGIGIKVIIGRGAPAYSLAVDDRGP